LIWQGGIPHQHLLPLNALPLLVSSTPQCVVTHAVDIRHAEKCTAPIQQIILSLAHPSEVLLHPVPSLQ